MHQELACGRTQPAHRTDSTIEDGQTKSAAPAARVGMRSPGRGQVLVLFSLLLLVLLGVSAIAIDYATWLLTDRHLQNAADHAAFAGASEFRDRQTQGSCSGGAGQQKCIDARMQMWTSISDELNLGLTPTIIDCLSREGGIAGQPGNTAAGGDTNSARAATNGCTAEPVIEFGHRIWVTTPPPNYAAYTSPGGRYSNNFGVAFTRVDRDVPSFLGGALGVKAQPRHGWATAGALPIGFALQTFCRNDIAPESGVCVNAAGVTIDGQGGIRLLRGDIGSNESLKVTANGGQGVQLHKGNMFLVHDICQASTWRCPNGPPSLGGISDGYPSYTGKNAFYIAPLPVPRFASPLDVASVSHWDCTGASSTDLCIPHKDQNSVSPSQPGTWTCLTTGSVNRCGLPAVTSGTVTCVGQGGGLPPLHYYPVGPSLTSVNADAAHPQSNANKFMNIDDDFEVPDADTTDPPGNPSTDYLYTDDINITGAGRSKDDFFHREPWAVWSASLRHEHGSVHGVQDLRRGAEQHRKPGSAAGDAARRHDDDQRRSMAGPHRCHRSRRVHRRRRGDSARSVQLIASRVHVRELRWHGCGR